MVELNSLANMESHHLGYCILTGDDVLMRPFNNQSNSLTNLSKAEIRRLNRIRASFIQANGTEDSNQNRGCELAPRLSSAWQTCHPGMLHWRRPRGT